MKQPMPLSHLAAARATSSTSLRLAPRNNFITLQISPRSPSDKLPHHACGWVIIIFILIIFLVSVFLLFTGDPTNLTGPVTRPVKRFLKKVIHRIGLGSFREAPWR